MKSISSLLAPAHPGGPGKRAVKRLWCGVWWYVLHVVVCGKEKEYTFSALTLLVGHPEEHPAYKN